MPKPASREEYKQNILRRLGKPVVEINVDDDQLEDRIDEALEYYADYHFDGTSKEYYKHLITVDDVNNKYFTIPENIIGAVRIFEIGNALSTNNLFNIRYQIALNDLYTLTNVSVVPYYIALQHVQLLEQLLVGQQPIRFNRHMNRLYVDMDWELLQVGSYIIVEAYMVIDPEEYTDVWADRWLLRYGAALVKKQWGTNMKKFTGMMLPGGVQFSGQQIFNEAEKEVSELEHEMINSYSLPVSDMIG